MTLRDFSLIPPVGADRVDMGGVFARAREGDPLAVGRVIGVEVLRIVVGKSNPILSVDGHRVDLAVVVRIVSDSLAREDDLLTVGRVRRTEILRSVVGDLELARSVGVDRVDLCVVKAPRLLGGT